jgi:hypothetical protein
VDIVLALEDNLVDGMHVVDSYQVVVYMVDHRVVERSLVKLVFDTLRVMDLMMQLVVVEDLVEVVVDSLVDLLVVMYKVAVVVIAVEVLEECQ